MHNFPFIDLEQLTLSSTLLNLRTQTRNSEYNCRRSFVGCFPNYSCSKTSSSKYNSSWLLRKKLLKKYSVNKGPAAGHGHKHTKCPAVRNIHQNATERFLQTCYDYQMFFKKCKAIPKINLFFWWINSPSLRMLQHRSVVDTEILRF